MQNMTQFIKPDLEKCKAAFAKMDVDKTGNLSLSEFQNAFKQLGIDLSDQDVKMMMDLVETDNDDTMSFEEFCQFMYIVQNADFSNIASILFFEADTDFAGEIDKKELKKMFEKLQCDVTDKDVEDIFKVDADAADGNISYNAFINLIAQLMGPD